MEEATERYFRGRWQMVRIMENVPEGVIGEFWGEAEFTPDGAGLTCRESGVLRYQGADYSAERQSLWRFPGGGRVEVRYPDGRPFHDFIAEDPRAAHLCGDDRYDVTYDFADHHWRSAWAVKGPAKNYMMSTLYRRLTADGRPMEGPLATATATATAADPEGQAAEARPGGIGSSVSTSGSSSPGWKR
ncbi:MAG: DUF6314 family protein [Pseudomonadota bacterium]